jgi:uncharacterized protein Yka (UPF0111/DUF47 family)
MAKKLLKHFQAKQRSVEERMEAGKKLRNKFPRIKQGEYHPAKKRSDPIAILEAQGSHHGGRPCSTWQNYRPPGAGVR